MQPFTYLVPALFFNATVNTLKQLGDDALGGSRSVFEFESATIQSEPEFELQFKGKFELGVNYATTNTAEGVSYPDLNGVVIPEDGATPFKLHVSGVQAGNEAVLPVIIGNTPSGIEVPYGKVYRILTAKFEGAEARYRVLESSVFVGSETVSDSGTPGKFILGIKISKVYPTQTNITIGDEF